MIRDLDVNPIPDFDLVHSWKRGGIVSIATSRGCPYSCTFCSVPGMYGHAFRTNSVDRVIEELKSHRDASYVFFADDIFTANKRRTKELLSRMIAEGMTPEWGAQVRTETVDDPEVLRADAAKQLLQRVRRLRVDQPSDAQALPEEAGSGQDRALDRAVPRTQGPHPRDVRHRIGRRRPRDLGRHREVRHVSRAGVGPVHDPDTLPRLPGLGPSVRQGQQRHPDLRLEPVRRTPRRPPAPQAVPVRAAGRLHARHAKILFVGQHRTEPCDTPGSFHGGYPALRQAPHPGMAQGQHRLRGQAAAKPVRRGRACAGGGLGENVEACGGPGHLPPAAVGVTPATVPGGPRGRGHTASRRTCRRPPKPT